MQDKNTEFDLLVRSMMQTAEEPVPSRVWSAVSGRLDRLDARKRALLWWRRTAVAVAAAAAVALGIFFAGTGNNSTDQLISTQPNNQLAVAADPAETVMPSQDPGAPATAALAAPVRNAVARPHSRTAVPTEVTSPEQVETREEAPAAPAEEAPVAEEVPVADPTEGVAEVSVRQERAVPDYTGDAEKLNALLKEETSRPKAGTALSFGGNVQTNGNPSSGFAGMRAAQATKRTTGIQELGSNSVYGAPVSFGVGVRFGLGGRWSMGTGLTYSLLTRSFSGIYTEVDGNENIVNSISADIRNTQHYLGIPVNFYFDIINQPAFKFYTYAGGTFEKNLLNRYSIANSPSNIIYRQPVSGIQISAGGGFGVEFMLGPHFGLYVDPSLRYYFNCYQPKSIRTQQPLMLNLEVGMRFGIGR